MNKNNPLLFAAFCFVLIGCVTSNPRKTVSSSASDTKIFSFSLAPKGADGLTNQEYAFPTTSGDKVVYSINVSGPASLKIKRGNKPIFDHVINGHYDNEEIAADGNVISPIYYIFDFAYASTNRVEGNIKFQNSH